jgi:hypothetical protein
MFDVERSLFDVRLGSGCFSFRLGVEVVFRSGGCDET